MKEPINILCATDNNYAPYCGIMLTSLFESNKDCRFEVFVFVDDTFSSNKSFDKLGAKYNQRINIVAVDDSKIEGLPVVEGWVTSPTYYRLLASELLPEHIHRIIYLDCDVIVSGDIKPLWNVDLEGMAVAGVKDYYLSKYGRGWRNDMPNDYINAGVLVIDLDLWRKEGISGLVLGYLWTNNDDKSKVYYMDQDALNAVLLDKKLVLPERFNYQVDIFNKHHWQYYSEEQRICFIEEGKAVSIIHYLGKKPWRSKKNYGPFFHRWEEMRRKSLWPNCRARIPLNKQIRFWIKRAFFPGLLRQQMQELWFMPKALCLFPSSLMI